MILRVGEMAYGAFEWIGPHAGVVGSRGCLLDNESQYQAFESHSQATHNTNYDKNIA